MCLTIAVISCLSVNSANVCYEFSVVAPVVQARFGRAQRQASCHVGALIGRRCITAPGLQVDRRSHCRHELDFCNAQTSFSFRPTTLHCVLYSTLKLCVTTKSALQANPTVQHQYKRPRRHSRALVHHQWGCTTSPCLANLFSRLPRVCRNSSPSQTLFNIFQASASPCPLASSPRSSSPTSVPSSHGSTSPSSSVVWPLVCSTSATRLERLALGFSLPLL
jgi:hypothetical protein